MTVDPIAANQQRLSFDRSRELMAEARQWLAGGVSSNFRLGISPTPLVIERAEGPYVFDADGNRLIDYYLGMGPMMLGHNPASVRSAVAAQLERGILFAGQSNLEFEAAELVCRMVPCAERIRFTSSASEAVQGALRLARAATGRSRILKFEGHYHGWFDNVLWSVAPSLDAAGVRERPVPVAGSRGQIADGCVDVLPWNDLALLSERVASGEFAAVIMEPAMCNAGAIAPAPGYLAGVKEVCARFGTLLILDETITGFRLAAGGAQQRFGVTPDLAVFGKAIANGFPVAAIAGRAELLDLFAAGVVHGGTYNAQPLCIAATVATLQALAEPSVYETIARRGARLMEGVRAALREAGIAACVTGFPEVFHVGFGPTEPARDYRDLTRMDRARYVAFTTALLRRGVRPLERGAWFMSAAHDDAVVEETLYAVGAAAREIAA